MSSKYSKKRKERDDDTSGLGSDSTSPKPKRSHKSAKQEEENNDEPAESISIEETNRIRISLGLAPLETEDNKVRDANDGTNDKIYNEDGFEFRHRKADNWADKKREKEMKEKLDISKQKRDVYNKVLKSKKLADSDDEDDAKNWIEKMRQKDDEAKKAAEREKMFNQLDDDLGVSSTISSMKTTTKKTKKRTDESTAGLVVGHGREAFIDSDQILVLQDKGVLDDGDEVLVNPNMLDDERHKRNVELRKRKDPHRNFDEDVDEFGNVKDFGVLAKYDQELEGAQGERKQFRLDATGGVDLAEEQREIEMYRKLKMAGKRLETLEMPKYQLASEFYTQDEMVEFRKNKKGKKEKNTRKRKTLKASDLVPVEKAGEGKSRELGRRRRNGSDDEQEPSEDKSKNGEPSSKAEDDAEEDGKWKKALHGNGVDLVRLQKLKAKTVGKDSDEEDSDDDMAGGVDLTGVVIDDDAADELHSILSKTRKVKQSEESKVDQDDVGKRVQKIMESHGVKMEEDEEEETKEGMFIDSTMEYCRHIGEINTLGLGGNREVDLEETVKKEIKEEVVEEQNDEGFEKWNRDKVDKELKAKQKRRLEEKGGWLAAGQPIQGSSSSRMSSDDEEAIEEAKKKNWSEESSDGEEKDDYTPALGREADVSKGVGAMLKLAAQKGYLTDPNSKSYSGPSLEHLKNHAKTQIDGSRFDIEDKYMKKLDRLGTTSRGPLQSFPEKTDYHPDVNISYVDRKGREMDAKDAYRELSYKFHGRNPGKKQLEKRANRKDKEERMLKTNSYDTPLGTLSKQLKKQKQLSTPYLVLSGSNDHSSLKKE